MTLYESLLWQLYRLAIALRDRGAPVADRMVRRLHVLWSAAYLRRCGDADPLVLG